jgi:cell wall-associated NlpC family hydrolase
MLGRVSTTLSPVAGAALLGLAVALAACSTIPTRAPVPDRSIDHRGLDRQWAQRAVEVAMQHKGAPYRWGGEAPSGFDCSGFVRYVYAQVGISLPHNAAMQFQYGTPVARSDLQPGDLVFFDRLRHNGIYIGEGRFIHSRQTGKVVAVANLDDDWYRTHWAGGRRL